MMRTLALASLILIAPLPLACGRIAGWDLERRLQELPDVEGVRVVDDGEFSTWLVAIIRTRSGGEIAFNGITRSWLDRSASIRITHIDGKVLTCDNGNSYGFARGAEVADGPNSNAPGLGITNVQSALRAYSDLRAVFEEMPDTEEQAVRDGKACYVAPSDAADYYLPHGDR